MSTKNIIKFMVLSAFMIVYTLVVWALAEISADNYIICPKCKKTSYVDTYFETANNRQYPKRKKIKQRSEMTRYRTIDYYDKGIPDHRNKSKKDKIKEEKKFNYRNVKTRVALAGKGASCSDLTCYNNIQSIYEFLQ